MPLVRQSLSPLSGFFLTEGPGERPLPHLHNVLSRRVSRYRQMDLPTFRIQAVHTKLRDNPHFPSPRAVAYSQVENRVHRASKELFPWESLDGMIYSIAGSRLL